MKKNVKQTNSIEPTSYLWRELLTEIKLPKDGVVIEAAPGYEPKIANALAVYGFRGNIFLIEPDPRAAAHIRKLYHRILPHATITTIIKPLQDTIIGIDIPRKADALVASHPFDDMVMAYIAKETDFFSREKESGASTPSFQKFYRSLQNKDYREGMQKTVRAWQRFIKNAKPHYCIASQYPSHTLAVQGLIQRQQSGYTALRKLKRYYKHNLIQQRRRTSYGFKGDPRWWIVMKNTHADSKSPPRTPNINRPRAIKRLGESLFIPEPARRLHAWEYDIVYADQKYFGNANPTHTAKQIRNLAVVLDHTGPAAPESVITYADRQKDKTGIGLEGNLGSGRAVYYGSRYNILGVGKTALCKSTTPSHSTGRLECIGAMRRIVLSQWLNHVTKRAPAHPLLIALKETARFKWNKNPIPLCLLVRIDEGRLDRPSHVEASPRIPVDFKNILTEYARLDAEYFAYRFMLGAWSTSNYSLNGHVIDLESASFVKYRSPYHTSSSAYPHNRFGYEGLGFIKILRQLAKIKNRNEKNIQSRFYRERQKHLGRCLLSLLGIPKKYASRFFSHHEDRITELARQFEVLSKKIITPSVNVDLYRPISEDADPALLDMSRLFRNLAARYGSPCAEEKMLRDVLRKTPQPYITPINAPLNAAEIFLQKRAVVTKDKVQNFLRDTKTFIRMLIQLLSLLDAEKCLKSKYQWNKRLRRINQDLPPMYALNKTLSSFAESYRRGTINPRTLGANITAVCKLPKRLA